MLIIHGTRREKTRLGLVAELCHSCRDIRPALVTQITQYSHVYFVPVGSKKVVGYEITCNGCSRTQAAAAVPYQDYCKDDPGDIGLLVELTNPAAVDRLEQRVALEERLAGGTATRADRVAVITETISAAGLPFQTRLRNVLPATMFALIATAVFIGTWATMMCLPGHDPITLYGSAGAAGLSFAAFIYTAATGKRRIIRRKILPKLAADLAPLDPTTSELAQALLSLIKAKLTLARMLKPGSLHAAIQAASPPPPL
jgi:hypothetical protein